MFATYDVIVFNSLLRMTSLAKYQSCLTSRDKCLLRVMSFAKCLLLMTSMAKCVIIMTSLANYLYGMTSLFFLYVYCI